MNKRKVPEGSAETAGQTQAPTKFQPRLDWMATFAAGLAVFAGGAVIALRHTMAGWEVSIFRSINNWPQRLHVWFVAASLAPQSMWIGVAAVVVPFVLKLHRLAWQMAVSVFAGGGAVYVLKTIIGRPRPAALLDHVHVRAHETDFGFPSGHTTIITVVLLTLWPYLPSKGRWALLVLIPIVGLSRLYLGVHAPLDVLGGVGLGMMVVGGLRMLPARARAFFRLD